MNFTPEQLRFASIPGCTIRADFQGGGLSSDLGPLLLKGVDRQIGLTERLCAAINDTRHHSYITHTLHDILKQRIFQIACGYEEGNDCNTLRHDPVFRLGVGHKPFDTDDAAGALASGSTISRLEHAVSSRWPFTIIITKVPATIFEGLLAHWWPQCYVPESAQPARRMR